LTEVPDHLLKRSRDRRAALGLGGGDDGGDAAPAAAATPATTPGTAAAVPAAARAAVPEPAAPKPPAFVPPYVRAAERRSRIPVWALPVVAFLPIWGVLYAQSLSAAPSKELSQLAAGAQVFSSCSTCHGPTGGGGVGRPLSDGQVLLTFPNIANQLEFVRRGDVGFNNGKYGNPNRPGGQHGGGYNGAFMPAFANLTDAQLLEVVRHERETLSGEKDGFKVDSTGARLWSNGKPVLNSSGKLQWDDGTAMFTPDGKLSKQVDASQKPG
jgi:mono/diheme cytochrome c family protein